MTNVAIRLATPNDREQILALLDQLEAIAHQLKNEDYEVGTIIKRGNDFLADLLAENTARVFVAEHDGQLIGLATFFFQPHIRSGKLRGHIEDFVVDQQYRGQHIGSQIMEAIFTFCRENDIKVVKLGSGVELLEAHKFYEKHGGKTTERLFRFDV